MYEALWNIYKFIWIVRLRIKIMPEKDFFNLVEELDFDTAIYAVLFRYI